MASIWMMMKSRRNASSARRKEADGTRATKLTDRGWSEWWLMRWTFISWKRTTKRWFWTYGAEEGYCLHLESATSAEDKTMPTTSITNQQNGSRCCFAVCQSACLSLIGTIADEMDQVESEFLFFITKIYRKKVPIDLPSHRLLCSHRLHKLI